MYGAIGQSYPKCAVSTARNNVGIGTAKLGKRKHGGQTAGMTRHTATLLAVLCLISFALAPPARAFDDRAVIDGFNRTVFGSEYLGDRFARAYVRKFTRPVRFYVRSRVGREPIGQVHQFISELPGLIGNLRVQLMSSVRSANFVVHLVSRAQYADTVKRIVLRNPNARVRGKCMVRSVFSKGGITRSDAVIVVDEGAALFSRCMTEEILQGLGPLNDDPTLVGSMFNDTSPYTEFRRFDRLILNALYDPRIRVGASPGTVAPLLPMVVRDVRARIEG